MLNYLNFLLESQIQNLQSELDIKIKFNINSTRHAVDSLNRNNNEPDRFGETIITNNVVTQIVKKALIQFSIKRIFTGHPNIWIGNKLKKNLCVKCNDDNAVLILDVSKKLANKEFTFVVDIITAMRNKDFVCKDDDIYTIILN